MSDYQMNINGRLKNTDLKNIEKYLDIVDLNDNLVITLLQHGLGDEEAVQNLCINNQIQIEKKESREGIFRITGVKGK